MEFGKLEDISGIDWKLPSDDPLNVTRLKPGAPSRLYVGGTAWGTKAWIGKIYPEGTTSNKFLSYYAKNFNCIELNATHYKIPDERTTHDWLNQVAEGFKFCPKIHKDISHSKFGLLDPFELKKWYEFLGRIGSYLGPCFIQFHEMFSYEEKNFLFKFLEQWPAEFKLSIELRHKSWFENHYILPALTNYLHKKNIGLVITDVAGRRDVLHTSLSTEWTMIRLIGNKLVQSDEDRLNDWASRIQSWQNSGQKETFLFLHQPDDLLTVEFAQLAEKVLCQYQLPDFSRIQRIKTRDLFNQE